MKINDVIISEAPVAGAPGNVTKTGTGASGFPINQTGVPANQRPNMVRDPRLLTNIDGGAGAIAGAQAGKVTSKKAAPKKAAPKKAAPVDQAAVPASANASSSYTGAPAAAPAAVEPATPSAGTTAEIDRLKQLAIGGQQPAAQAEPAAAEPAAGQRPGGIAFNQDAGTTAAEPAAAPAAGQRPGGIAFNQDAGTTAPEPAAQAAQPAPAPAPAAPAPAPAAPAPAAPSTVAPVVKTGSGGTLTTRDGKPVTSRSDDEIAWAQKNPYQPYPGPGWQEKQKAQGDANAAAVKGFLNKINPFAKKEPAPVAGQGGQAAPANPGSPQAPAAFRQGQMESAELAIIRKLSGLK